jgi:hypothetical protein
LAGERESGQSEPWTWDVPCIQPAAEGAYSDFASATRLADATGDKGAVRDYLGLGPADSETGTVLLAKARTLTADGEPGADE